MDQNDNDSGCSASDDSTYYVENDDMGESSFQFFVVHRLVELLQHFFEVEGRAAFVSGNQYMHLERGNSEANLAPDVYVIPDERLAEDAVRSWKLWEHNGKGPCLAVEVVADDAKEARKDYDPATLEKYQRMGVKELFRYDPYGVGRTAFGVARELLTHYVRQPDGRLAAQPLAGPGRAQSTLFDFSLLHVPPRQLRLAVGPAGAALFPSRQEAQQALLLRAEEESRRAEEESRRAEEAERLLSEARAEIARLKGSL